VPQYKAERVGLPYKTTCEDSINGAEQTAEQKLEAAKEELKAAEQELKAAEQELEAAQRRNASQETVSALIEARDLAQRLANIKMRRFVACTAAVEAQMSRQMRAPSSCPIAKKQEMPTKQETSPKLQQTGRSQSWLAWLSVFSPSASTSSIVCPTEPPKSSKSSICLEQHSLVQSQAHLQLRHRRPAVTGS